MILGILQARFSSSRLPGKVMRPILGKPMLLHQIARISRAHNIDHLTVATSTDSTDDPIADMCRNNQIGCYRGSLEDVLDRFYQAGAVQKPEYVVRLTGDCPLTDPEVIDRVIALCRDGHYDYASNALNPTFPDGLDAEVIRWPVLVQTWQEARKPSEREHVTPFIHQQPTRYKIGELRSPVDYSAFRWTVDEPADFEFVRRIYEALYPNNLQFSMNDILMLLERRPDLLALNKHIGRNEGYAASVQRETMTGGKPHV